MDQPHQKPDQNQSAQAPDQQGVPQPPPPFSCTFAPNVPELLQQMNISLAVSTYQAGKVILISPKSRDELIQLPRNFAKPMGIAVMENKLAIASLDEVILFSNSAGLAKDYPLQPNTYDTMFAPRGTLITGEIDIHDLEWGKDGLWAVNTRYSCLSRIDENFSFIPEWIPSFITELQPEDRCHLNGVAFLDGKPKYATALGISNTMGGWREKKATGGILIDIDTNEIVLQGLPMPHSPRLYDGNLFLLLSGTGEIVRVDIENKRYDILKSMNGFVRGMDRYGDYLFIGLSKLRTTSTAFQDLPVSQKSVFAGIMVMYLPSMSTVGYIKYEASVDEIFDVRVIPGTTRPGIMNTMKPEHKWGIVTPDNSMWLLPNKP